MPRHGRTTWCGLIWLWSPAMTPSVSRHPPSSADDLRATHFPCRHMGCEGARGVEGGHAALYPPCRFAAWMLGRGGFPSLHATLGKASPLSSQADEKKELAGASNQVRVFSQSSLSSATASPLFQEAPQRFILSARRISAVAAQQEMRVRRIAVALASRDPAKRGREKKKKKKRTQARKNFCCKPEPADSAVPLVLVRCGVAHAPFPPAVRVTSQ